jgi:hypothetical protein
MMSLLLAATLSASPVDSADLRVQAEAAYWAGLQERGDSAKARPHFIRAAEAYQQIWENGNRDPATARSMAQARLLAGDVGRAIRDYRRGLRIAPHDPELHRGLDAARERVAFPNTGDLAQAARARDPGSRIDRLGVSFAMLLLVSIAAWAAGWFLIARAWIISRGGLALTGGALVLVAMGFAAWLWWEDSRLRAHWSAPAAVVVAPTELRTGNNGEYAPRIEGRLPAGVEIRILGERGGWLHVELADGAAGWLPANRAVVVD